jgi:pimeloyl-ACP methyl ester carboxylesterase
VLKQEHFSVLGWSDGGITGLIVAGRYPDLVRRLVVWGANAYILPSDMPLFKSKFSLLGIYVVIYYYYFFLTKVVFSSLFNLLEPI